MAAHAERPRTLGRHEHRVGRAEQLGEPLGGQQEEDWRKDRQQQGAEDAQPEPGAGHGLRPRRGGGAGAQSVADAALGQE